jgi:hypothetical protein
MDDASKTAERTIVSAHLTSVEDDYPRQHENPHALSDFLVDSAGGQHDGNKTAETQTAEARQGSLAELYLDSSPRNHDTNMLHAGYRFVPRLFSVGCAELGSRD